MLTTEREGFTLIELLVVLIIFGFMSMSLAAIYSTANNHMLQGYRQNTVKSNALLAMKAISSRLSEATLIDSPPAAGESNVLAFVSNMDQLTGCYPVNPAEDVIWHQFCHSPGITAQCKYGNCLYYHTGRVTGGGGCPDGPAWQPVYPQCGSTVVGTVIQLASFIQPPAGGYIFSRVRPAQDGTMGNTLLSVSLRAVWDPSAAQASGKFSAARPIDTTLNTTVSVISAGR